MEHLEEIKSIERHKYKCPVYRNSVRAGNSTDQSKNYVTSIDLDCREDPEFWILRGVFQVHFDTYLVKYYNIIDDSSLLLKTQTLNKFSCMQLCSMESSCVYVKFEKKECIMYSYNQTFNLSLSSDRIIYQKKNFNFQERDSNENLLHDTCLNSSHFWSINFNSCIPCKPGFNKYSELPFNFYHNGTVSKNFSESRLYCQSKGGVLFRPITQNERYFFKDFQIKHVDSSITYV
ncbi:unnamed protein product [Brachionus calyciflorus]|uniref:Uncharacterized protein n=1 Tax=Brachionus calyciflorus TaxID=104777 RepID=A0A813ZL19_9BILA|nr:unnamed protein product [Brachionus calyciflorus]